LQQAAFDDLIFRVDVMRNVASRHLQEEDEEPKLNEASKWGSLPILNLVDKEELKSTEVEDQNGEEGLQEASFCRFSKVSRCNRVFAGGRKVRNSRSAKRKCS
jgi:hypothetical protein